MATTVGPSASLRQEFVAGNLHGFPLPWENKARIRPVEGRIGSVYGTVVVRADEHHVVQRIVTTAALPVHVVRFTEVALVDGLRVPSAKLADAPVEFSQFFHVLRVAPGCLLEQIASALIRNAGGFFRNKTPNSNRIAEEDPGLQLLFRQQASPRLGRKVPSVFREQLVVFRGQQPHGCVPLKGSSDHRRARLDGEPSDEPGDVGLAFSTEVAGLREVAPESILPVTVFARVPRLRADDKLCGEDVDASRRPRESPEAVTMINPV